MIGWALHSDGTAVDNTLCRASVSRMPGPTVIVFRSSKASENNKKGFKIIMKILLAEP